MSSSNYPLIYPDTTEYLDKAREIAERIGTSVKGDEPCDKHPELLLRIGKDGLYLERNGLTVQADFEEMLPRLKTNNLRGELLVKAAKLSKGKEGPTAVDATAGFGEDSFLLAASGFFVTLFEYDKVIFELLRDAVERGKNNPELSDILNRMTVVSGDSVEGMKRLDFTPDVVYLDPMFPERNKSGLIKKKFQLLQKLETPCDNGEELLSSAISTGAHKIIIKRPLKGAPLTAHKPSYTIEGKAILYDVIVFA